MILYDCHAHVFEQIAAVPGARYVPDAPAPLGHWRNHLQEHGLRGGVIVQVSFLGCDNTELCKALEKLDPVHFAGVAVAAPTMSNQEIDDLASLGVRGFRWNLVRGATIPDLQDSTVRSFLERIFMRNMHVEVHLESQRLSHFIGPLLACGGSVVVDHLGLPNDSNPTNDPWLKAITEIDDLSTLYVKFSGAYRTPFNTELHKSALLAQLDPDHVVWGSDWPHTQHKSHANYHSVATTRNSSKFLSDAKAVRTLYGLGAID